MHDTIEMCYPSSERRIKEMNDIYDELDVSGHYDDMAKKRGVKNEDWSQSLDYRWVFSKEAEQLLKCLLGLVERYIDHWNSLATLFPGYRRPEMVCTTYFKKEGELLKLRPTGIPDNFLLAARSDNQRKDVIRAEL